MKINNEHYVGYDEIISLILISLLLPCSSIKTVIENFCWHCSQINYPTPVIGGCSNFLCPLYLYKDGVLPEGQSISDMTHGVRDYCNNCCHGSLQRIMSCPYKACVFHAFRLPEIGVDSSSLIKSENLWVSRGGLVFEEWVRRNEI